MIAWTRAALPALTLVLLLGTLGCGGDESSPSGDRSSVALESAPAQGGDSPLADTWMYLVASKPESIAPIEGDAAWDPWYAFFHNDLQRASELFAKVCTPSGKPLSARAADGFVCVGRARTHLELSAFYADAAELDRVVLRQLYAHREAKADEVLPSVHSDFFYGLVLLRSGAEANGRERLSSYNSTATKDPFLSSVAARILADDVVALRIWAGGKGELSEAPLLADLGSSSVTSNYAARVAFMTAVARGKLTEARSLLRAVRASQPDLAEVLEGGDTSAVIKPELPHNDPGFLVAMSRFHALIALEAIGGAVELAILTAQAERLLGRAGSLPESVPSLPEGLPLVLFASESRPEDLLSAERSYPAASALSVRFKGLEPALGIAPTLNVADLDPYVAGSNKLTMKLGQFIEASNPGAEAMDTDMVLSERFRGEILRERARQYQASFDVRLDAETGADIATAGVATRSLLELALDKNPAPPNPSLREARISLRNDPTLLIALARAELDTRRPSEANDYVRPLSSVYPDLVPTRDALTLLDTAWNPPRAGAVQK